MMRTMPTMTPDPSDPHVRAAMVGLLGTRGVMTVPQALKQIERVAGLKRSGGGDAPGGVDGRAPALVTPESLLRTLVGMGVVGVETSENTFRFSDTPEEAEKSLAMAREYEPDQNRQRVSLQRAMEEFWK
jgi:hypothetical protein